MENFPDFTLLGALSALLTVKGIPAVRDLLERPVWLLHTHPHRAAAGWSRLNLFTTVYSGGLIVDSCLSILLEQAILLEHSRGSEGVPGPIIYQVAAAPGDNSKGQLSLKNILD